MQVDHGEKAYIGSVKLAELAPAYVMLASDNSSYMTGSTVQVTGGSPTI